MSLKIPTDRSVQIQESFLPYNRQKVPCCSSQTGTVIFLSSGMPFPHGLLPWGSVRRTPSLPGSGWLPWLRHCSFLLFSGVSIKLKCCFSLNHFYLLIFLHLRKFNFYKNLLLRQKPHSSFGKICVLHTLPSASIISGILSRTNLLYTFIMTPLMKPSKSRNLVFLQNRIQVEYFSQGCL